MGFVLARKNLNGSFKGNRAPEGTGARKSKIVNPKWGIVVGRKNFQGRSS
jgi:hypothetical protein